MEGKQKFGDVTTCSSASRLFVVTQIVSELNDTSLQPAMANQAAADPSLASLHAVDVTRLNSSSLLTCSYFYNAAAIPESIWN